MIKINKYLNRLTELPRPNRRELENIVKEIYNEGVQEQKKRVIKFFKLHGK